MRIKHLVIFFVMMLVAGQLMASTEAKGNSEGEWKQIYDKKGIVGLERSFPGSEFKEFKAVAFIDARMEVVGEVIRDIPSYPEWMAECKKAEVLKEIDRNTKIFYNEVSTPWPVPNRGVIITNQTKYDLDTGRAVITFKALKDDEKYPIPKGRVQIVDLTGKYLLEFFGRNRTRVTYTHKADPAGKIPVKMANFKSRLYPVINLKGLRKMVKLEKYQELGRQCPEHDLIESMLVSDESVERISKKRLQEFVLDKEIINRVFDDKTVVQKIKKERASFDSIKNLVVDTCKTMMKDEEIRKMYRNKSLREVVVLDKFFEDTELARMIAQDSRFVGLLMEDEDLSRKILSDRLLLAKILDSNRLAKKIANDPKLVSKMVSDDTFARMITESVPGFESLGDLRAVVSQYMETQKQ